MSKLTECSSCGQPLCFPAEYFAAHFCVAQHDDHVLAWRWYRLAQTGLMVSMVEIWATGDVEQRFIDPADLYDAPSRY